MNRTQWIFCNFTFRVWMYRTFFETVRPSILSPTFEFFCWAFKGPQGAATKSVIDTLCMFAADWGGTSCGRPLEEILASWEGHERALGEVVPQPLHRIPPPSSLNFYHLKIRTMQSCVVKADDRFPRFQRYVASFAWQEQRSQAISGHAKGKKNWHEIPLLPECMSACSYCFCRA